jgi:hypothetical protein
MNWRSGLTRLYVVVWVLWGAGTGFLAARDVKETQEHTAPAPPPVMADTTSMTMDLDTVGSAARALVQVEREREAAAAALREHRSWVARHVRQTTGLWVLCGALFPGGLLLTTRWVWAGFARQSRPKA